MVDLTFVSAQDKLFAVIDHRASRSGELIGPWRSLGGFLICFTRKPRETMQRTKLDLYRTGV